MLEKQHVGASLLLAGLRLISAQKQKIMEHTGNQGP